MQLTHPIRPSSAAPPAQTVIPVYLGGKPALLRLVKPSGELAPADVKAVTNTTIINFKSVFPGNISPYATAQVPAPPGESGYRQVKLSGQWHLDTQPPPADLFQYFPTSATPVGTPAQQTGITAKQIGWIGDVFNRLTGTLQWGMCGCGQTAVCSCEDCSAPLCQSHISTVNNEVILCPTCAISADTDIEPPFEEVVANVNRHLGGKYPGATIYIGEQGVVRLSLSRGYSWPQISQIADELESVLKFFGYAAWVDHATMKVNFA